MRTLGVWPIVALWAVCAEAQPFPGAVLVGGGWVPCTHQAAISAGLGCVPGRTIQALTGPMEVGRFYRNLADNCEIKVLAVAVTFFHRRPMLVAETTGSRVYDTCAEVAYFFDPTRPPDGNWIDVTDTIPPEWRVPATAR